MRLIFMGTPDFAVPTLVELAARGHDIVGRLYARVEAGWPRPRPAADTSRARSAAALAAGPHAEDAER